MVACAYDGLVGCPSLGWGAEQVEVPSVIAGAGATILLRSSRAFCVCGLRTTG